MAGTRRSARQSTATGPKYAEDSASLSEEEAPKRNRKKATRRKRARDEDEDADVKDEDSPPPKKISKAKPNASLSTSKSTPTSKPRNAATAPSLPSSDTNRDANGNQEVFWLLKAEPLPRFENGVNVAFSIDDLQSCKEPEPWTGVRNPQARNNMQAMRKGDLGFFYHSNAKPSGVVGVLRVVNEAHVDETAFDPKDPYYDSKSEKSKPKWYCVDVEFVKKFKEVVDLKTIKDNAASGGPLANMQLVKLGRLSVCRVTRREWEFIHELAGEEVVDDVKAKMKEIEA